MLYNHGRNDKKFYNVDDLKSILYKTNNKILSDINEYHYLETDKYNILNKLNDEIRNELLSAKTESIEFDVYNKDIVNFLND